MAAPGSTRLYYKLVLLAERAEAADVKRGLLRRVDRVANAIGDTGDACIEATQLVALKAARLERVAAAHLRSKQAEAAAAPDLTYPEAAGGDSEGLADDMQALGKALLALCTKLMARHGAPALDAVNFAVVAVQRVVGAAQRDGTELSEQSRCDAIEAGLPLALLAAFERRPRLSCAQAAALASLVRALGGERALYTVAAIAAAPISKPYENSLSEAIARFVASAGLQSSGGLVANLCVAVHRALGCCSQGGFGCTNAAAPSVDAVSSAAALAMRRVGMQRCVERRCARCTRVGADGAVAYTGAAVITEACGGCTRAAYCGAECQRADWAVHAVECAAWKHVSAMHVSAT